MLACFIDRDGKIHRHVGVIFPAPMEFWIDATVIDNSLPKELKLAPR
jgi:hypothetical protein